MEILRKNFEREFENIEKFLREATFIAIDSECTGLLKNIENKTGLFDTASERYLKLKRHLEEYVIVHIGVTAFKFKEEDYNFIAHTFTVPLFPRSCSSIDKRFLCQASSMEFLCHSSFNFNKFVYDGVPYLSYKNENEIREELQHGTLFRHLERTVSMDDERKIQEQCSRVAEWVPNAAINDIFQTEQETVDYQSGKLAEYLLLIELRRRFPTVWTSVQNGHVIVKKVCQEDRLLLEADRDAETKHQEDLVNHFLGFSRIFKLLTDLRKPIVGYSPLLELMLMYNQFFEPLPKLYSTFKNKINLLFPSIYDIRYISIELKKVFGKESMESDTLFKLFQFFKVGLGFNFTLNSPKLEGAVNFTPRETSSLVNEPGWQSYCIGFCFLKLAFLNAENKRGSLCMPSKSKKYTFTELSFTLKELQNKISVHNADIRYISLDSNDPEPDEPKLLVAFTKKNVNIDISEIVEILAKYGPVDVKSQSCNTVLIAVGNVTTYRDILLAFSRPGKFTIVRYNPLKHTLLGKVFSISAMALCTSATLWFLTKKLDSVRFVPPKIR